MGPGAGAASLALLAAREACREGGALVVVDRHGTFYPPAAADGGVEPAGVVVVRPRSAKDHAWALTQALRCAGVAATLAWDESFSNRTWRRLQLAAEQGGGLGLMIRPARVRDTPSWAEVRLLVRPLTSQRGRRLQVELLRCRGGWGGQTVVLEYDDETGAMCDGTVRDGITQRGLQSEQGGRPGNATRPGSLPARKAQ